MSGYVLQYQGIPIVNSYAPSPQIATDKLVAYIADSLADCAGDLLTIVDMGSWQSFPNHPDYDYCYRISVAMDKHETATSCAQCKLLRDVKIVGV